MTNIRLLIIHQGALGDVILSFAAIIALRKQFGRIDILCQGQIGTLAARLGLVDKTYPLEAAYFATLFSDTADDRIKALIGSYDRIVVFSFSTELEITINQLAAMPCMRIPPRPSARQSIHVAEFLLQNLIAGRLIEAADATDVVSGWQQKTHKADRLIDALKIIIHPGAGSIRKRWPLNRFLELAYVLAERGLQPQFLCGPAETDLDNDIRRYGHHVHRFSELADLADWLETAFGYIGNDSGISQLAAFMGIPSVVIFGPTDPERWTPPGPSVRAVRPAVDCDPCFEITPQNCDQPACRTDATLESVIRAIDDVLGHRRFFTACHKNVRNNAKK